MKLFPATLILSAIAALSFTSCVEPGYGGGYSSIGTGYGYGSNYGNNYGNGYNSYASLPGNYVGSAYLYNGRYYSGGRYQTGSYLNQGRSYTSRYYHNGQYLYGGSHQSHGHSISQPSGGSHIDHNRGPFNAPRPHLWPHVPVALDEQAPMKALQQLFFAELALRHDSELQQISGLPQIARAATCTHLQKLITAHLGETESHLEKLNRVFKSFDEAIVTRPCEVTASELRECRSLEAEFKDSHAINAALIGAAQKIEHLEIASYGSLLAWAGLLGNPEAAGLLDELLDQEKAANRSLIKLARFRCNKEALSEIGSSSSSSDRYGHEIVKTAA